VFHQNSNRPVVTAQLDRCYRPAGAKPTLEHLQALRLKLHHEVLRKWNYTISPKSVKLFLRQLLVVHEGSALCKVVF
jgi:hypothetical protein